MGIQFDFDRAGNRDKKPAALRCCIVPFRARFVVVLLPC
jgi:hypothetical protein